MSTISGEAGSHERLARFTSRDDAETLRLGRRLGESLAPGAVIALVGPLGAGKTRFVRGLAEGAGVAEKDAVRSPTYVLHHVYRAARFRIHHVDAYRLRGPEDYAALDVPGSMDPGDVLVVEWADRVARSLPPSATWIAIEIPADPARSRSERVLRTPEGGAAARAWVSG